MNLTRDLIFLVLYLIGVFSIVYWRKQKKILPCSFTAVRGHLR